MERENKRLARFAEQDARKRLTVALTAIAKIRTMANVYSSLDSDEVLALLGKVK